MTVDDVKKEENEADENQQAGVGKTSQFE